MKVKQKSQEVWFVQRMFLFLMLAVFAGVVPATTVNVKNADFENGSDRLNADDWTEPTGNVYYRLTSGTYDTGTISGRAATIRSTGAASINQVLEGVYADSYDIYRISFDIGYRNDTYTEADINYLQVALKDGTSTIAYEKIVIGKPVIDGSQYPNVGTVMRRTVVLKVNRMEQPNHQLSIWFINKDSATNPDHQALVIDNISIIANRRNAQWNFEENLNDETGAHNGTRLSEGDLYDVGPELDPSRSLYCWAPYNKGMSASHSSSLDGSYFTVTAWAYAFDVTSPDYRAVVSNRDGGSDRSGYMIYATPAGKWEFWTGANGAVDWDKLGRESTGNEIVSGQYAFIAVSFEKTGDYDDTEMIGCKRLYINGKYIAYKSGVRYRKVPTNVPFLIGAGNNGLPGYGYFFNGLIDDVRFYNYRLPDLEVAEMYAKKKETSPQIGTQFKVMTYNIKHLSQSGESLEKVALNIIDSNPDVVCLQEVDEGQDLILNYAMNNRYPYGQWTKVYLPSNPDRGNAILSKTSLLTVNEYTLPQGESSQVRKMTVVTTIIHGRAYTIANTHFAHEDTESGQDARNMQAESVVNTLNYCANPTILTGDLNDNPYEPACDRLKQLLYDTYTENGVDHIMIGRNTFHDEVISAEQITTYHDVASDHDPIVTTFELQ